MKSTIAAGMDTLRSTATDPSAFRDALESLNDPETLKEVRKLMDDPNFKKEMEILKNDPMFLSAAEKARTVFEDPQKAAELVSELSKMNRDKASDAQLGLAELGKAAKDPKLLAEAMEMLKDPTISAEVVRKWSTLH